MNLESRSSKACQLQSNSRPSCRSEFCRKFHNPIINCLFVYFRWRRISSDSDEHREGDRVRGGGGSVSGGDWGWSRGRGARGGWGRGRPRDRQRQKEAHDERRRHSRRYVTGVMITDEKMDLQDGKQQMRLWKFAKIPAFIRVFHNPM